jgi:hypothetical protein
VPSHRGCIIYAAPMRRHRKDASRGGAVRHPEVFVWGKGGGRLLHCSIDRLYIQVYFVNVGATDVIKATAEYSVYW